MFWGLILVAIGTSMILNHLFKIDVPVVQIAIGIGFIYFGLNWIFGSFNIDMSPRVTDSAAIFGSGKFEFSNNSGEAGSSKTKYDVVFGSGFVDLRNINLKNENIQIKTDTVFGETKVLVDPTIPYIVRSSTVFGNSQLHKEGRSIIGTQTFRSKNFDESTPHLVITANVVFGNFVLIDELGDAAKDSDWVTEN